MQRVWTRGPWSQASHIFPPLWRGEPPLRPPSSVQPCWRPPREVLRSSFVQSNGVRVATKRGWKLLHCDDFRSHKPACRWFLFAAFDYWRVFPMRNVQEMWMYLWQVGNMTIYAIIWEMYGYYKKYGCLCSFNKSPAAALKRIFPKRFWGTMPSLFSKKHSIS